MLEIVVSSIKPTQLLIGKIIGVGLVRGIEQKTAHKEKKQIANQFKHIAYVGEHAERYGHVLIYRGVAFGIVPVIIGLVSSMAVIPNPNGLFAIIMSMIPFTSPMVMNNETNSFLLPV